MSAARGYMGAMEARMRWWMALAAVGACSGDEPHDCDAGTPTCESTLTVALPDPRTQFRLRVSDELGMAVDMDCPAEEAGVFEGYTAVCGGGRLTITSNLTLGSDVEVQIDEGLTEVYHPTYSKGGDFCGNECDQGTIQL